MKIKKNATHSSSTKFRSTSEDNLRAEGNMKIKSVIWLINHFMCHNTPVDDEYVKNIFESFWCDFTQNFINESFIFYFGIQQSGLYSPRRMKNTLT